MQLSEFDILVLPGWQNSEPEHWQTLFENEFAGTRINQNDWNTPKQVDWVERVNEVVQNSSKPIVFLAHSLGCHTVIKWAEKYQANIHCAFLVSPPDLDRNDMPKEISDFFPISSFRLPFPSIVVGTDSDPYVSLNRLQEIADCWGAEFFQSKSSGHINVTSGNGLWEEGLELFRNFVVACGEK